MIECGTSILIAVILGCVSLMEFVIIIMLLISTIRGKKPKIISGDSE